MPSVEMPLTPDALRAQLPLDGHGRLARDVPCLRCGYNLRSADPDGRCPECGLSVGRSTLGHWLRFRDPKWVRNIYWGMNRFAVAVVAAVFLIGFLVVGSWMDWRGPALEELIILIIASSIAVCIAFALAGVWRATRPDPDFRADERLFSWRRLTRLALPCSILGIVVISLNANHNWGYGSRWPYWIAQLANLLIILGSAGVVALLLMHGQKIARTIPHRMLAWVAILTAASMLSSPVLMVVIDTASDQTLSYLWSGASYTHYDWIDTVESVAWLAKLVCGVWIGLACLWLAPLSFWFRHVMAREALAAERTWAAVGVAVTPGAEPRTQ